MPNPNAPRKRSKTIAFRVTPPEVDEQTNLIVAASGMTKQAYIESKLLDMEVTIVPSTYTYEFCRIGEDWDGIVFRSSGCNEELELHVEPIVDINVF